MTTKQNCNITRIKRIKHCLREDIQNALDSLNEVADFKYDVYLKSKCIRIRLNDNDHFFISYKNYSISEITNHDNRWKKKIFNKLQKEVTKPSYRHIFIVSTNDGYTLNDINLNYSNVCKKTIIDSINTFVCYFTIEDMKLFSLQHPGKIRYEKDDYAEIPPDFDEPLDDTEDYSKHIDKKNKKLKNVSESIQIASFLKRIGADKSSRKVGTDKPDFPIQENIYVFILDTGIFNHPNLNIRKDLCKNFTTDNDYIDERGHGTHVAGIIGAKGLYGVYGVSPGVQLISYKVLNATGKGQKNDIMRALQDVLDFKLNNTTSQIIVNMSLSGNPSEEEDKLVENLISNNITVVIAAGNQGISATLRSPARSKGLTVGSYDDENNIFAKRSNYGKPVDILAPGVKIKSTWINNSYEIRSGTSMATPVVTGSIVNMVARSMKNGKILTPYEIKTRLQGDAQKSFKDEINPIINDTKNEYGTFTYSTYIGDDKLY
jgi:Subtilase family